MTRIPSCLILLVALSGLGGPGSAAAADNCPGTGAKDVSGTLEYLRGDRKSLEPKCVVASIRYIAAQRYLPSISVLVQYLDYADPTASAQRRSVLEVYPALDALVSFRKPSSQYLVSAIADPETPELARENAAIAIQFTYSAMPPEGVALLVRTAHEQADPLASIRLMDKARWLAHRCPEPARNNCENAVLK